MTSWSWRGSRWWRFDFHAHSPASTDYGRGPDQQNLQQRQPRQWLLDYMGAGIDCVAITDHNCGAWVDEVKTALRDLDSAKPQGYRPIHIFPGVEISVHGGVHLLAILGRDKTTPDIDTLLGTVGYAGTKGSSDEVTSRTFAEVVKAITEVGGIAIPAHVDEEKGVFKQQGTTLEQALACKQVIAAEVIDPQASKPQLYSDKKPRWTEVLGSDAHHPEGEPGTNCPGSRFTWIKMGEPSIEGLRLALLDGALSVRRSDQQQGSPNKHAASVVESIEISDARFLGREHPFEIGFNPWLNAIIGGRGTGKSTVIELLRIALRREGELPSELKSEFEKYGRVYADRKDGGLLTGKSAIEVIYRKNDSRFRIRWDPSGSLEPIEEEVDGQWRPAQGEIRQRFPVRIYSQKQIFQLAKQPLALLGVVDESPKVDRQAWNEKWNEEQTRFLSLRSKAREFEAGLAEEPRLRGELDDVVRKLTLFEKSGHADVLEVFQKRSRQQREVEVWEQGSTGAGEKLRRVAAEVVPDPLAQELFDKNSAADAELRKHAQELCNSLYTIRTALEALAEDADGADAKWQRSKGASAWKTSVDAAASGYRELRESLARAEAGDPAACGEFVQRRQVIESRLKEMAGRRKEVASIREQAATHLQEMLRTRQELTASRRKFLAEELRDNPHIRITVQSYDSRDTVEDEFRRLLQRTDGAFEKDIGSPNGGGLLGVLYGGSATDIETNLQMLKKKVSAIASGECDPEIVSDRRFATHLGKLQPEVLDRVDLWFPEDSLEVTYSPTGDGRDFRSIHEGSPGQKTAALLAFLLSYGEEPLILDQPEDDLDNELIYHLIVAQLRKVKLDRQVIVVTHNANIVVNGDSELVVCLSVRNGSTHKECDGNLQEAPVREKICEVMEGGIDAFNQRYRRIALKEHHA